MSDAGPVSRALGLIAEVEPREAKAVVISFVYFFFLLASYFILRPLRDTMGTVYGVAHLQELFTGTFLLSFVVAPVFAGLASRIRLAVFLPWVYQCGRYKYPVVDISRGIHHHCFSGASLGGGKAQARRHR